MTPSSTVEARVQALKPCPFCTGEAVLHGSNTGPLLVGWFVVCGGCGVSTKCSELADSGTSVIATWNIRAEVSGKDAERHSPDVNVREVLVRLESAVDYHLGRSSFTQTKHLKGFEYSERVRKELYAAHDAARATIQSTKEKS